MKNEKKKAMEKRFDKSIGFNDISNRLGIL